MSVAVMRLRPSSEQLAVPLDQCLAFKLRKGFAALVRLARPHTAHGSSTGVPEAVQLLGLVTEMAV
jgi:hypothetical protein